MKFIDVTALSDASVATDDNQSIGNLKFLEVETDQADYGTFELNQFVLMEIRMLCRIYRATLYFECWNSREKTVYFRKS